ncbi:MAG: sulfur oxidation c-type cytochrome SoxA [Betaproteobacteria bacterium]|nr:sulfur oxidation c-type cytochrome SoxA [Betaproteobacteria bacterium]
MVLAAYAEPTRILSEIKSGRDFQSREVQAQQADDFANPGMLWVERGAGLWKTIEGEAGKSCASCHGDAGQSMRGVAARYPSYDAEAKRILDLEARIVQCRSHHQRAAAWKYESEEMLAITAYVAQQSRRMPIKVSIDGGARATFEAGQRLYTTRVGQLNLACTHCHDRQWGRKLLADTVSQGQPNGYPTYRLDWQTLGSLQRRIRACFYGVRAELPAFGSEDITALELYLAWRGEGLVIETPAVRK